MKVLIIGFGNHASGLDAAEYYKSFGHDVTLLEKRDPALVSSLYEKMEKIGVNVINNEITAKEIKEYDLVIKTPGSPLPHHILRSAKEITNDLAALFSDPETEQMRKIVIIGNKGKTSLASAVSHALNILGAKSVVCGSIGISGFNILEDIRKKGKEIYTDLVIEMTNWQISDTSYMLYNSWPHINIVAMTKNVNKKGEKKESYSLFGPWTDIAIVDKSSKDHFLKFVQNRKPKKTIFTPTTFNPHKGYEPLESAYEILKALGYHKKDIVRALQSYKGIPNRIEQVAFKNSILYINDSAATIPESVTFTIKMIGQASIHLICGGSDKSGSIEESGMRIPFKMAASITLLSGSFTDRLILYLEKNGISYSGPFSEMKDAVLSAKEKADEMLKMGSNTQIILLAPGSSSYDYFENEFDRGDKFKEIVYALTEK